MESLEDLTLPSTVFWTNAVGGNWMTPSNWSTGAVPGPNDDVIIDMPGVMVTHSYGFNSARSLTSRGKLTMTGGRLTLANTSEVRNDLTFTGGVLGGTGDLTVTGLLTWSGGMMQGAGQTHVTGGMLFYAAFNNGLDGRTLNNSGVVQWNGRGTLELTNGAVFNNRVGAHFLVQGSATFRLGWYDQVASTFNNHGTFRVNYSEDVTSFTQNSYRLGVVFNNTGTLHLQNGHVTLAGSGTNSGTIDVGASWRLNLAAGNYMINAGSQVQGAGWLRVLGATVSINTDVVAPNVELSSGIIAGTSMLAVTGTLSWTGGQFYGMGTTLVATGAQLDISGTAPKYLTQRLLLNLGTATWTGAGNIVLRPDGILLNYTDALFNIRTDAAVAMEGSASAFVNYGTLRKILSSGMTRIDTWFENHGVVDVQTGTLHLIYGMGSGAYRVTGALQFAPPQDSAHILDAASTITGAGTVIFNGIVHMGGTYNVSGATRIDAVYVAFGQPATMGTLAFSAGDVDLLGHLTINGLFTWTGGGIAAVGQVNAYGGMAISGTASKMFSGGTLANGGMATWTGTGSLEFQGTAIFINRSGATFDARSDATITFGEGTSGFLNQGVLRKSGGTGLTTFNGTLSNHGRVEVTSGRLDLRGWGDNLGSIWVAGTAGLIVDSLTFSPTGSLTGSGNVWFNGVANTLAGTYNITGTTYVNGVVIIPGMARTGALHNLGFVYVDAAGSLTVSGNYTQQAGGTSYLAGGSVAVQGLMDIQAGVLHGWGTITGNVRNAGRLVVGDVSFAGQLTINGGYTQTAAGILDIEIGGIEPGVQYDQLRISGHATLDGTLNIMLLNGFVANTDDNFRIVTFGSRTGQFATINGLDLGGGLFFQPRYNGTSLDLVAIRN